MTQTGAADERLREVLAFSRPVQGDGVTVIPAAAVRTHRATRADGVGPDGRGFDASMSGGRPLGAFVVRDGRVRWWPVVDATRVITTAELVVGAVLVARRLADRPSGARAAVSMGPGGWVSMKGGSMAVRPARRGWRRLPVSVAPPRRRPWWARLLAAVPLQSLVG
ncbi:hypothetical protein [Blastococcus sp. TF02A-26]|uniref:hypothetical protein n=1 Tax=Blastococcus sp. TF02A-26 TaxID=2250577 RepID=UPI0018F30577|nr:hypothetical protein [Blastococcus sp. TF02A-26]